MPLPPDGLSEEAVETWQVWMASWVASNWTPGDVPGLRQVVRLFDMVVTYHRDPIAWKQDEETGKWEGTRRPNPTSDMRMMMDTYGITPKGQQDRRWVAPEQPAEPGKKPAAPSPYAGLKVVSS